jgi:hypothetical protein
LNSSIHFLQPTFPLVIGLDTIDYKMVEFELAKHSPVQVSSYTLNFAQDPFIIIPAIPVSSECEAWNITYAKTGNVPPTNRADELDNFGWTHQPGLQAQILPILF